MTASPSVSNSVAIADPSQPGNVIKPNADGSINVVGGGGGGGGAVTIADGANAVEGFTTDAAATAGGAGTISAKLRRISSQLPAALGQATMAASEPVAIASDQSDLPIKPGATETKITAAAMPTGGVGFVGWLSAIWYALAGIASGTTDSGNPVKIGGVFNSTLPTLTNGQRGDNQVGVSGVLYATPGAAVYTPTVGQSLSSWAMTLAVRGSAALSSGIQVLPVKYNGTTLDLDRKPNSSYPTLASAAGSTNATVAKASAGDLWCISGFNAAASVRWMKVFNKSTAPTVGTDTPVLNVPLPIGLFNITYSGQYFGAGISFALTTGAPLLDAGAVTAGDIVGLTLTYA